MILRPGIAGFFQPLPIDSTFSFSKSKRREKTILQTQNRLLFRHFGGRENHVDLKKKAIFSPLGRPYRGRNKAFVTSKNENTPFFYFGFQLLLLLLPRRCKEITPTSCDQIASCGHRAAFGPKRQRCQTDWND
jgi:hypothetical protein